MITLSTKAMTAIILTYLSGGALLQIKPITDFIELDDIGGFFYYAGGGAYLLYWVSKRAVELWKEVKEEKRKDRE
jgi:hypothetical protein